MANSKKIQAIELTIESLSLILVASIIIAGATHWLTPLLFALIGLPIATILFKIYVPESPYYLYKKSMLRETSEVF